MGRTDNKQGEKTGKVVSYLDEYHKVNEMKGSHFNGWSEEASLGGRRQS